jgi:hypothetical protein
VPLAKKLDAVLGRHTFAAGEKLNLVDFTVYEGGELLFHYDEATFNTLTNLKAHHERFSNIEQIKAYKSSDRYLARPFAPTSFTNWG